MHPQPEAPRSCAPVNYQDFLSAPKTQGDTSFCFAYSSAELIHQRTGQDVSAVDLAMAFYFADPVGLTHERNPLIQSYLAHHPSATIRFERDRYRPDVEIEGKHPFFHHLEGGFEPTTLILANLRGLCLETRLPSANGLSPYTHILHKLERQALQGIGERGPEVARITARFRDREADIFHTLWMREVKGMCRHFPSPVPLIPVEFSIAANSTDFKVKSLHGQLGPREQDQVFAALDFALSNGRIAAIGVDLNAYLAKPDPEDGDHSVTVVARRRAEGGCQYLIRDSSGYECDDMEPEIRKRCQASQAWINEAELRRSIYSVSYLR